MLQNQATVELSNTPTAVEYNSTQRQEKDVSTIKQSKNKRTQIVRKDPRLTQGIKGRNSLFCAEFDIVAVQLVPNFIYNQSKLLQYKTSFLTNFLDFTSKYCNCVAY